MAERLVATLLLAITSLLIVVSASAGESLRFDNTTVETEQQDLEKVRALRKIRSQVNAVHQRLYVVQFKDSIQLWDRQNVETLKAKVLSYIPDDALVIRATAKVAQTIRMSSPNVRVVLPYDPSWKLSSALPLPSILTKDQVVNANIKFSSDKDANHSLEKIQALPNTEILEMDKDHAVVRTLPVHLAPISALETVVWIANVLESAVVGARHDTEEAAVREYLINERKLVAPSEALLATAVYHSQRDMLSLSKAFIVDETEGIASGDQHIYPINVNQMGKLVVTLTYIDKEYSPASGLEIANDLDVAVVDPMGREVALQAKDQPLEHTEIAVNPGAFEIRVKGITIPAGKQPYALLISVR